ncbi:RNA polymerase sigma factor [Sphingomonas cannabina]|uniref:RNA polymerase sigma factor n=1 Tax=Sphingomonas cannabina TaxID=2899123 RepID=UPI001F390DB4|nr:RNA polymerase sigma factor [Sphingomonas cannabina]UIJ46340.1 RNA polymerase sigma factor [Sphingomonas cannabina]
MRLNLTSDEIGGACGTARLAEGDPLPPENRVVRVVPERSLDDLYRAETPRLMRFFSSRSGGDDPRDLVHETFERLVRKGAAFLSALDRPEAYLSRIAINLVRDRAKFAVRHHAAAHVRADDASLATGDPHDRLEARDMIKRLETAMKRLRPLTREIFMACRLDGYSYAEVAERTGLSVRAVRKQMSRAIAEIDRALSED